MRWQLSGEYVLFITLGLLAILCFALYHIRRYRRELGELQSRFQEQAERRRKADKQREEFCQQLGHDLDEGCLCRRCLIEHHDWEVIETEEHWVETEPGALYLSADFQPTGHYETSERVRCRRCHKVTTRSG